VELAAHGGWQRSSVLGKDQADLDLILTQPTIRETAWVQIKSQTSQAELNDYLGRFRRDRSCDRFFFRLPQRWRRSLPATRAAPAPVDRRPPVGRRDRRRAIQLAD
jgi:hypothetical protein